VRLYKYDLINYIKYLQVIDEIAALSDRFTTQYEGASFDDIKASLTANLTSAEAHVANLKDQWKLKRKELCEVIAKQVRRPIHDRLEKILEEYQIVRQQYHSQALIGKHCDRLLENHDAICDKILELFLHGVRRPGLGASINDKIRTVVEMVREGLKLLESICLLTMRINHQATDAECDQLDSLIASFGSLWRTPEFTSFQSCTIKLHGLECIAGMQFRAFRTLGQFMEQPIERLHNIRNKDYRHYANVAGWRNQISIILATNEQRKIPEVQAEIDKVKKADSETLVKST